MIYDLLILFFRSSAWWGRLKVEGLEHVPKTGALLVAANHDSQWDPIMMALAIRSRRRLRFLAKASLWRVPGLAPILWGAGQIPVERGSGNSKPLDKAVEVLERGKAAVCIFPEGRLSWGETVKAKSGVGRLAQSCGKVQVVLCTVEGQTDFVRFPRRPRVKVTFFPPAGGGLQNDEEPADFSARLLAEIRERVPPAPAGRRGTCRRSSSCEESCV